MFKKRPQVKTVNLVQDAQTIVVDQIKRQEYHQEQRQSNPITKQNKKINTFTMRQTKTEEPVIVKTEYDVKVQMGLAPQPNQKYGLIDQANQQKPKVSTNLIMDMYVKEKLKQYTKKQQTVANVKMQTASEIFQIERKYLEPTEQKISSYDVNEIQRKLELMSAELIKSEQEKRTQYLKNLLENQIERVQYASKKQLKMIRQEKERDEKYLNANYSKQGRRHQINKMKNEAFNDFINNNN